MIKKIGTYFRKGTRALFQKNPPAWSRNEMIIAFILGGEVGTVIYRFRYSGW